MSGDRSGNYPNYNRRGIIQDQTTDKTPNGLLENRSQSRNRNENYDTRGRSRDRNNRRREESRSQSNYRVSTNRDCVRCHRC